ncbi:sugar phosphate isomerase/epimerase [Jiulongibacter sediminis]|uniref:sugar phosphate isomerase/epimerase family protein n=1 Tax=Jiulongibacter sediminis TaxID=1605367 RepID=UPI0026F1D6DC|nr:TIM barrel protein [Jiulongibacter sediminis]
MKRRSFVASLPLAAVLSKIQLPSSQFPLSSNSYNWITFYTREGKTWGENPDADMSEYARTGLKAYEPSLSSIEQAEKLIAAMKKHNIQLPSVYIGSILHEKRELTKSMENMLSIAETVAAYDTKIIVTNPNPIAWGSDLLKNDDQLQVQAEALEKLGKALKTKGLTLAYHTHDPEFKAGAREFHHMLQNTSPEHLKFCMDVHWIYRGSANSQLAAFDVLKMYGNRIAELHLRQSSDGIFQEVFTEAGDIDYKKFAEELSKANIHPHLVIEQCLEKGSPKTMNALAAHIKDKTAVEQTFKKIIQP